MFRNTQFETAAYVPLYQPCWMPAPAPSASFAFVFVPFWIVRWWKRTPVSAGRRLKTDRAYFASSTTFALRSAVSRQLVGSVPSTTTFARWIDRQPFSSIAQPETS